MFLKVKKPQFILFLSFLFLINCNNKEVINFNSDQLDAQLDARRFEIDSEASYSYRLPLDSLSTLDSYALYASSDFKIPPNFEDSYESVILLSVDLNDIVQGDACQSDNIIGIDSVKFSLKSYNNDLVNRQEAGPGDDVFYVDSTGIDIWWAENSWDEEQNAYELFFNEDGTFNEGNKQPLEFALSTDKLIIDIFSFKDCNEGGTICEGDDDWDSDTMGDGIYSNNDQAFGIEDLCNRDKLDFFVTYDIDKCDDTGDCIDPSNLPEQSEDSSIPLLKDILN